MSLVRHLGFGSTPNFNNLLSVVSKTQSYDRLKAANYDPSLGIPPTAEQIEILQKDAPLPRLSFSGTEKLHGENMAVCFTQGESWVQGRNYVRSIGDDQNGMAQFVENTKDTWTQIALYVADMYGVNLDTHTIVLDCEWAGGNIQRGNAACSGTDKGAYLFEYFRVVSNTDDSDQILCKMPLFEFDGVNIFTISSFGKFHITLDLSDKAACNAALEKLATEVEAASPIAAFYDKPDNVGEGVYLYCMATEDHPTYRLKAKGLKHGGAPKTPKTQNPESDEKQKELQLLADKVTPEWRLTQAITETGATAQKDVGNVIKWVHADIIKEEMPLMLEHDIDYKQLSRYVSAIVKTYFFEQL